MPRISEEHRMQIRENIVESARLAFLDKGFQRTSMSEIIQRTGMSAGAIYNHFSGKEEITVAAATIDLEIFLHENTPRLGGVGAGQPEKMEPWAYVLNWLETLRVNPATCRLLQSTWGEAATYEVVRKVADTQLEALKNAAKERYRGWAQAALEFDEEELEEWLEVIGAAVLSVFCGYVLQSQTLSHFSHDSYRDFAEAILTQA